MKLPISSTLLFSIVALAFMMGGVPAHSAPSFPEVETKWPGVRFQLFRIERSPLNRLIVAVRIVATDKAPGSGTFLGARTAVPPTATREDIAMGLYDPKPFSLVDSEMIDEQTGRRYAVLPSIAPPGKKYPPSTILKSLLPGQSEILIIQFAIPSSPPGDKSRKQTASFLLPDAKGPLANVPIPSAEPVNDGSDQSR